MAIVKVVRPQLVSFLLGLVAALALAAHAKSTSEFEISVTAKGKIEMECSYGCAWEQLSWKCSANVAGFTGRVLITPLGSNVSVCYSA